MGAAAAKIAPPHDDFAQERAEFEQQREEFKEAKYGFLDQKNDFLQAAVKSFIALVPELDDEDVDELMAALAAHRKQLRAALDRMLDERAH